MNMEQWEALNRALPRIPPIDARCHNGICSQNDCEYCQRVLEARRALLACKMEAIVSKMANQMLDTFAHALLRSPYDISPCMECGNPVVCVPSGTPLCEKCGRRSSMETLRLVIGPDEFEKLVRGKVVTIECNVSQPALPNLPRVAEVALADIGWPVMLSTIEEAWQEWEDAHDAE